MLGLTATLSLLSKFNTVSLWENFYLFSLFFPCLAPTLFVRSPGVSTPAHASRKRNADLSWFCTWSLAEGTQEGGQRCPRPFLRSELTTFPRPWGSKTTPLTVLLHRTNAGGATLLGFISRAATSSALPGRSKPELLNLGSADAQRVRT